MCFRGGGVGHINTRDATNRFLTDRHPLDAATDEDIIEDEGEEVEGGDEDMQDMGLDEAGSGGDGSDKNVERGDEEMQELNSEGHDDDGYDSGANGGEDDEEGRNSDNDLDNMDLGPSGGWAGFEEVRGDEEDDSEDDYGYKIVSDMMDSDEESDTEELGENLPDDVLGPEDGGGEEDEVNMLGFADF